METKTTISHFIYLFLYLHFTCSTKCLKENFDESLDTTFHDSAFRALIHHHHPQTGTLYNTILPKNLSGIKVSFLRLRSRTLWRKGANFSNFIIPPKTRPVPHVKRILIVYHNLGNWSSLYYNVSGYALISPVIGFLVYNASNLDLSKLIELNNTLGKPVSVEFQNSTLATNRRRFCASFGGFGKFTLTEMSFSDNVCYSENEGHFSIVVPFRKKIRPFWIMGFAAGLVGVVAMGVAGTVAVGSFVRRRNQEMEKEADGECLETYRIGDSKMPRAKVTRTQPVLESTTPPNPRLSWYA
ncbi:hypothetical protein PHJA_000811400 [Phtheirospermum japonicum]|uniref:Transmembrane protein n=1 Tax=Phtheirospermum japonicum TaxID=374723 RepID=A0A830BIH5_9LAMI|nr:hypothetical protein PHJA_000811400 [Phtheirospermum japonicum]